MLTKVIPYPVKKFRVKNVTENLKGHFTKCWKLEKSKSSKLSFYNTIKNKFARESYLDTVKGFSRRYSTSKLRISAHNLEIEQGRYTNTPRHERICKWCKLSIGSEMVEDEHHFLHDCDLYNDLRLKLISNLNKSPLINNTDNTDSHLQLNINNSSLKYNLMSLLSPYTDTNITENNTNMINHHHKAILNKHIRQNMGSDESKSSVQRHSFILNCVSTFMYRAIEKRQKFMSDLKVREVNANTIIINF